MKNNVLVAWIRAETEVDVVEWVEGMEVVYR